MHNILVSELEQNPEAEPERKELDGFSVSDKVYEFGTELRKQPAFRGLKFGKMPRYSGKTSDLLAYFPNQLFCLGTIAYDDHNIGLNSEIKYSYKVEARGIRNRKYRAGSKAENWALSTNLPQAVENAKKHFRPYTMQETLNATCYSAAARMSTSVNEFMWSSDKAMHAISDDLEYGTVKSKVYTELKHLKAIGYTFVTDGVEAMIDDAMEKEAAYTDLKSVTYQLFFLCAVPPAYSGAEPKVQVVEGGAILLDSMVRMKLDNAFRDVHLKPCHTVGIDTLPTALASRVSMLTMTDNGTFVEGVGYKVTNDIMYLLVGNE